MWNSVLPTNRGETKNVMVLPADQVQLLDWNLPVNLIGEKIEDPPLHGCEVCDMPILFYGRMIPCKHVFCYDCASQAANKCPRCNDAVSRIEKCEIGQVYLCTVGGSKHSYKSCRRTYLSQRDLEAHVNHRHKSTPQTQQPIQSQVHHQQPILRQNQEADSAQNNSKRGNLITIQIQNSR